MLTVTGRVGRCRSAGVSLGSGGDVGWLRQSCVGGEAVDMICGMANQKKKSAALARAREAILAKQQATIAALADYEMLDPDTTRQGINAARDETIAAAEATHRRAIADLDDKLADIVVRLRDAATAAEVTQLTGLSARRQKDYLTRAATNTANNDHGSATDSINDANSRDNVHRSVEMINDDGAAETVGHE